jgi:hypothetical protein
VQIQLAWQDRARRLQIALARGSRMRPTPRPIEVRLAGHAGVKRTVFDGRPVDASF